MVEEGVVDDVDEELGRAAADLRRPRHRYGALEILQAVRRLVFDGIPGRALLQLVIVTATLDHEAVDHTVEEQIVIMPSFDVLDHVLRGDRSFVVIKLEHDIAEIRGEFDLAHGCLTPQWKTKFFRKSRQ